MFRINPLLISAPLLLCTLGAQAEAFQNTRGLASSLAAGVSLHQASQSTTGEALVSYPGSIKPADTYGTVWDRYTGVGVYQGAPAVPGTPVVRDFSLDALFPDGNYPNYDPISNGGAPFHTLVKVNAFSTGNALIPPLDAAGRPDPRLAQSGGAGNWLGVVASVESGAQGNSPSSFVALAGQNGRSNGSDLFSYYYKGSDGLHPSLPGSNFLEQRREDLGLGVGQEVDGLDLAMGVRARSSTTPIQMFGSFSDVYYFSLTKSSAQAINNATTNQFWVDGQGSWQRASAAAVYALVFDNSAGTAGAWGGVIEHRSPAVLGLDPLEDDLDALEVQGLPGPATQSSMIYSFARRARTGVTYSTPEPPSQLMIHGRVAGAMGRYELQDPGQNYQAVSVADRIGLDDEDDVDAVCVVDPEGGTMTSHVGTPITGLDEAGFTQSDAFDVQLGISMTRSQKVDDNGFPVVGLDTYHVQVGSVLGDGMSLYLTTDFSGWGSTAFVSLPGSIPRLHNQPETFTWSFDRPTPPGEFSPGFYGDFGVIALITDSTSNPSAPPVLTGASLLTKMRVD